MAGIVGAFLGPLMGVVCIILVGQLGHVASICGLVMAFLAYQMELAKRAIQRAIQLLCSGEILPGSVPDTRQSPCSAPATMMAPRKEPTYPKSRRTHRYRDSGR